MAGFALLLIGIAIALWVSFWLLVVLFALGALAVLWSHLRDYLVRKNILNPRPGVPMSSAEEVVDVTVIEGDFTRITQEETPSGDPKP